MRMRLAFGVVLLLAAMTAHAYQLRFLDPADTTRWYQSEFTLKGTLALQPMNEQLPLVGTITFIAKEQVTGVNQDGTANLVNEITDGKVKINVADQTTDQSMTGYRTTFTRSPSGNVTNTEIQGGAGGIFGQMQSLGMSDQWKMLANLGQALEFPKTDVKAGDTWSNQASFEIAPDQVVEMKTTNRLIGPKMIADVPNYTFLEIDGNTSLKLPEMNLSIGVGDMAMSLKQSMAISGQSIALFDPQAGEFFRSMFNGTMKVTMTLPIAGRPAAHQHQRADQHQRSRVAHQRTGPGAANPRRTGNNGDLNHRGTGGIAGE